MDNWTEKLQPLIEYYKNKKHPLDYKNTYQLMIMVILSAQDSDVNINRIVPDLFNAYPNMQSLSVSNTDTLIPYISKVRNFEIKANWLIEIAQLLKEDKNIPSTMEGLIALKGIGRKSANVIMRETKVKAEGIIVDLHVIRVSPRIGLAQESKDGNKIEKQLIQILDSEIWGDIGMSISFLGREICRPTNPKCEICLINIHCKYYFSTQT